METAKFIVQAAKFYIGQTEKPNNGGFTNKSFEAEMVKAGFYKGAPWCAFFVKLIWLKAYKDNPHLAETIKQLNTGGALDTLKKHKSNGTFEVKDNPVPGAIVIWKLGNGPKGHAGIVTEIKGNIMLTVEGNTNAMGSREGDCVALKTRTINRPFGAKGLNVAGYIHPF